VVEGFGFDLDEISQFNLEIVGCCCGGLLV